MGTFKDRQGNIAGDGDRMRIVDSTSRYTMADGTVESAAGWYVIVEKVSTQISCIFAYKEDEPTTSFCINAKDVVLAPVDAVQPEVLVHPAPSGAHDVKLVEHEIAGAYSMYTVGSWEGSATLWHDTGRWKVSFRGAKDACDGGSVDEHPNTLEGAWAAWSSCHPLMQLAAGSVN